MTGAKPNRRRIWLLRLAAAALVAAPLLAGSGWFLLSTERGARWVLGSVGALAPGSLEIGETAGTLRGPLAVRRVRYQDEGLDVRVARDRKSVV